MKRFRKIAAVLLAVCMVSGLTACGSAAEDAADKEALEYFGRK